MLGMLRDFGAFLINYLFNVFISRFSFSPSSFIIINRYRNGILLPSPTGRGKPPLAAGRGALLIIRLIVFYQLREHLFNRASYHVVGNLVDGSFRITVHRDDDT